jgi:alpha-amylase
MRKVHILFLAVAVAAAAGFEASRFELKNGDRAVVVQLFSWRWSDVGAECTAFLGPNGFGAVQVSPPQEHYSSPGSEWWQHYQPVGYSLASALGSPAEFAEMVDACEAAGVSIIADVVINHMCGEESEGVGSGGSPFSGPLLSFPAVPFSPESFHSCPSNDPTPDCPTANCATPFDGDPSKNENCRLVGLLDLATGSSAVRSKIAAYLQTLLGLGVKGFRVDAAEHVPLSDLEAIFDLVGPLPGTQVHPLLLLESPASSAAYGALARVTDFAYAAHVNEKIEFHAAALIDPAAWASLPLGPAASLAFVVNHDKERDPRVPGSSHCEYRASYHCADGGARWRSAMAEAFALTYPHGLPRTMSGYVFAHHDEAPPSGPATDGLGGCLTQNGWDCRHREPHVAAMANMRRTTGASPLLLAHSPGNAMQIAYSLGSEGLVVVNAANGLLNPGDESLDAWLPTGLPPGYYCDAVGTFAGGCPSAVDPAWPVGLPGNVLRVTASRDVFVSIPYDAASRVLALHTGSASRIPTPALVPVRFTVTYAYTPGAHYRVRIAGSLPELGGWGCGGAVDVRTDATTWDLAYKYPSWSGVIYVPADTAFEWKPIKTDAACTFTEWGQGGNVAYTSPSPGNAGSTARYF